MRAVLVPGVLALLPEYVGRTDPVAELRVACREAVAWLVEAREPVTVLADEQGARVASCLLEEAGSPDGAGVPGCYLVVGNGSATRSEKAPGHLDERAAGFDELLGSALLAGDLAALAGLDTELAEQLWASTAGIVELSRLLTQDGIEPGRALTAYDDDPFGVQYWVLRWESP